MPRKIEYQYTDGSWRPWVLKEPCTHYPWRYAGGVLEHARVGAWVANGDQSQTIDEAQRVYPFVTFRLRPYEDGPRLVGHEDLLEYGALAHRMRLGDGGVWRARCGGIRALGRDIVGNSKLRRCPECDDESPAGPGLTPLPPEHKNMPCVATPDPALTTALRERDAALREVDRLRRQRDELDARRSVQGDELGAAQSRIRELEAACHRLRVRAEDAERKARRGR